MRDFELLATSIKLDEENNLIIDGNKRFCPYQPSEPNDVDITCSDWCPLFLIGKKEIVLMCGCEPITYELTK